MKHIRFAAVALLCLAAMGCPFLPPNLDLVEVGEDALDPDAITGDHLFRMAQISDTQLVDEESPSRTLLAETLITASWRPQEAYGTQTLDATIRVINQYHANQTGGHPIDFLIATGDLADLAQRNEMRWFIDVMDGKAVLPDSGLPDGANRPGAPAENPKLAFQAEGLDPAIPWYTVYGNHDGLAVGVFPIAYDGADPALWYAPLFDPVANFLGFFALTPSANFMMSTINQSAAVVTGLGPAVDATTLQLQVKSLLPGMIVPDPNRRFVDRDQFVAEHFDTTTMPIGHGFTEKKHGRRYANYSAQPVPNAPVRLVVLDTVCPDPLYGFPLEYGVLTRDQFENFLKPEFEAAKQNGEWVVVASHHPSSDFGRFYPGNVVSDAEFRTYLSSQPNLVAHICGHAHVNKVFRIDGPYPYFEILTCSIIDFPQEARILDVYYDAASETMTLVSDLISHMDDPTVLSAESNRRAVIDQEFSTGLKNDATWEDIAPSVESLAPPATTGASSAPEVHNPSPHEKFGQPWDRAFRATFKRPHP